MKRILLSILLCVLAAQPALAATLPTSNLTFHAKADVNTNVFEAGSTAEDADAVVEWESEVGANISSFANSGAGTEPTYRVNTPLMLWPNLDFDGGDNLTLRTDDNLSNITMSGVVGASAKTILIAFYAEAITSNNGTVYFNHALFAETGAYFGIFLKTPSGGNYEVRAYNFSGGTATVAKAISLATSHVVMVRHDGSNMYISLDGGSESSVGSGATDDLTGVALIAQGPGGGVNYNGRIGEIAVYNANLTGSTLSDAITYFTEKWVTGPPAVTCRGSFSMLGVGGC